MGREMTLIAGSIDNLGYIYCIRCRPVSAVDTYDDEGRRIPKTHTIVYSDSVYSEDECELCHEPIVAPGVVSSNGQFPVTGNKE